MGESVASTPRFCSTWPSNNEFSVRYKKLHELLLTPILNSHSSTLNFQLSTLNSYFSSLNSQLPTLNSQLSTLNSQLSIPNSQFSNNSYRALLRSSKSNSSSTELLLYKCRALALGQSFCSIALSTELSTLFEGHYTRSSSLLAIKPDNNPCSASTETGHRR